VLITLEITEVTHFLLDPKQPMSTDALWVYGQAIAIPVCRNI
jgi:hypothetical protein